MQDVIRRQRRTGWLIFGLWTLVSLVNLGAAFFVHLVDGEPFDVERALWRVVAWYTWVPTTMIILWLARRFPIDRQRWFFSVPLHLVGAVAMSVFSSSFYVGAQAGVALFSGELFSFAEGLRAAFSRYVAFDAAVYMAMVAVAHAFSYHRRYREREVLASRLQAQLAEAHLHALKMQLHPHFLFNTLNTIAMLVRQQREEDAVEMLAGLGELLRYVLDHAGDQEVTLEEEIALLRSYVALEQIRFDGRLTLDLDLAPDVLKARVPALLLQPLVENAIRHGIEPTGRAGRLKISARRDDAGLRLQVRDNGIGLPAGWGFEANRGIGLSNTQQRLERLYDHAYQMKISSGPAEGATVALTFPFNAIPETAMSQAFARLSEPAAPRLSPLFTKKQWPAFAR